MPVKGTRPSWSLAGRRGLGPCPRAEPLEQECEPGSVNVGARLGRLLAELAQESGCLGGRGLCEGAVSGCEGVCCVGDIHGDCGSGDVQE